MKNNMIIPIGILLTVLLIIAGGFLIFSDKSKNSGDSGKSGNEVNRTSILYVEKSENPAETYTSTFGELKRTADLGLKVGDKYYFHYVSKRPDTENSVSFPEEYDTMVEVKKIDRINKSDYYIIESSNVSIPPPRTLKKKDGVWKELPLRKMTTVIINANGTVQEKVQTGDTIAMEYEGCIIGINKENGEVHTINIPLSQCPVTYGMFSGWMLYLDKGVRWTEKMNMSVNGFNTLFEVEWEVKDIEKINGIDCFKVVQLAKTELTSGEGKRISGEVFTYWIDAGKRVLVKMEKKEDNILTETIDLQKYEPA